MNRLRLVRLVLAAAFGCAAGGAFAQQALEIIPLRHRTAEQVLPALQPLVEPGGTLSGQRGQLFLRASPGNVAEIKRALEAIDRPLRRLQISVRFDDARERARRDIEASGTFGSSGARVGVSAQDSRTAAGERVDQRLQVLEGSRAYIFTGQSRPLGTQGGTVIQDLATGFEVVPRLAGSEVILEILQRRDTRQAQQSAASTVNARLGEWVELGAVAQSISRDDRGIGSASRVHVDESRRIWVKVEELPN